MGRICVIRQGDFPLDPRVRREVEALATAGHDVDVMCLSRHGEPRYERNGRITVRRLPVHHSRGGLVRHMFDYFRFWLIATLLVGLLHLRRRYDVVQVNSIPDSLVFAAVIPRLLGARVLLDLHECMPEFYSTRFKAGPGHPAVRVVAWAEQASIRFADFAITCTEQMREAFVGRGAPGEKVGVVLNGSDERTFDADRYPSRERRPDQFVLVCHGTVEERYGLDTIVRAVALLRDEIPGLRLEIYGEGSYLEDLRRLTNDLGVEGHVYFSGGFVPMEELVRAISRADAGVVAMKRDAFRDLTLCNKMCDFITMRKPAIVSRTRSVEAYFGASCFQMFTSDDEHDLARAIRELHADPGLGDRLVRRAASVNEPYRWPHQRDLYRGIVESLIARKQVSTQRDVVTSGAPNVEI